MIILSALLAASLLSPAPRTHAVSVDVTPGHSTNALSPLRAIGGEVDDVPAASITVLTGNIG
jgi:hypothetical protein